MAIEIVNLPIENGGSFHSYVNVYQRVSCTAVRLAIPAIPDFFFEAAQAIEAGYYLVRRKNLVEIYHGN